ncbi:LOW QUALITY PROTEIN: hypothetical protein U9M48_043016 [Paspalum notatum var. saurae]|uniref:DUF4219 domain-containing protein n=1 Tax=Paspalum notatum var. saurae TaxID=547442 RepID=A0AAQ3URZ5_PASNO
MVWLLFATCLRELQLADFFTKAQIRAQHSFISPNSKTMWDVGGNTPYPQLTGTNYDSWVVMMMVMLEARGLWGAVETGTTERQEDRWAMEAILRAIPLEMHQVKATTKEVWDSLKKMWTGADMAKRAKIQQLLQEYELSSRTGKVSMFSLRLFTLVMRSWRVVPSKFSQLAQSLETPVDLETLAIGDFVSWFRVQEDRQARERGDRLRKCVEKGHWAHDCKAPRRQERAHLADEEDDEGPALLMAQVCAFQEEEEAQGKQLELRAHKCCWARRTRGVDGAEVEPRI